MPWSITAAEVRNANTVRIVFDVAMVQQDGVERDDTLRPQNYAITRESGNGPTLRVGRIYQLSPIDLLKVDIEFFPPNSDPLSIYRITASTSIRGAGGETPGSPIDVLFTPKGLSIVPVTGAELVYKQDLAYNPFTGKIKTTEQGAYEKHSGLPFLKKMIIRRAITVLGSFTYLPNLGTTLAENIKQLVRDGLLFRLEQQVYEQITQIAGVAEAKVVGSFAAPVLTLRLRARTVAGVADATITFNADTGEFKAGE